MRLPSAAPGSGATQRVVVRRRQGAGHPAGPVAVGRADAPGAARAPGGTTGILAGAPPPEAREGPAGAGRHDIGVKYRVGAERTAEVADPRGGPRPVVLPRARSTRCAPRTGALRARTAAALTAFDWDWETVVPLARCPPCRAATTAADQG
jgi:hypothetical protein